MTKKKLSLQKLIDVIEKLRDPVDGCQWDVQQTSKSLSPYIIEEAYELIEALESSYVDQICDELGDVLLQVVFQVQIAKEKNHFDMEQVINKAIDKMIRRHPHIFSSNGKQKTIEEQRLSWEKIKAKERLKKGESTSPFLKINSLLPAVNATTPEAFVVPINCLRIVICESLALLLSSVNKVLITLLGNLNND